MTVSHSPTRFRLVCLTALIGTLALGLASCAGAPGDVAPPSTSPLAPYFEVLYGESSDEQMAEQNTATQNLAAECMKEQGFEFEPDSASGVMVSSDDEGPQWGSREFAEQYGYGITSNPFTGETDGSGGGWVDPNADYLAGLSESERAAWEEALYGAPTGDLEGAVVYEAADYDWTAAGCLGAASHQVEVDSGFASADPEFTELLDEMQGLAAEAAESEAVVAVERDWSDCLAAAGHPDLEHKGEPSSDISKRYAELVRPGDAPADSTTIPEPDPDALSALKDDEIALATADADCARSSHYDDVLATELERLEQRFVNENRPRLDALLAKHGQG